VTIPLWAWVAFLAFVVAMLVLDLFVLHRRAHEVSLREAAIWSTVWIIAGLGFSGLVWAWAGSGGAQAYLAGYLIEKSLSVDNIFLFAAIFSALAIPARYQHRVPMFGIMGALLMRAAFITGGTGLLEAIHPVIYLFGAILLMAAASMLRGDNHAAPREPRMLRVLRRVEQVGEKQRKVRPPAIGRIEDYPGP
jgi:tellurite resistance protein TerC